MANNKDELEEYVIVARRMGSKISSGRVLKDGSKDRMKKEARERSRSTMRNIMYDVHKREELPKNLRDNKPEIVG